MSATIPTTHLFLWSVAVGDEPRAHHKALVPSIQRSLLVPTEKQKLIAGTSVKPTLFALLPSAQYISLTKLILLYFGFLKFIFLIK